VQVDRIFATSLTAVVNMDTGYTSLLTLAERLKFWN
jgi:hypothetical protein